MIDQNPANSQIEQYPRTDHAAEATRIISQTLDALYPLMTESVIVEEVWHELSQGVKGGWCTQEDADERFAIWYKHYHINREPPVQIPPVN